MIVRYTVDDEVRFGELREGERTAQAKRDNTIIVDDLVLPIAYEVKRKDTTPVKLGIPTFNRETREFEYEEGDPYQWVAEQFTEARRRSDEAGDGVVVDKLLETSVADGRAYYVITKVGPSVSEIEWRGFGFDRYYDEVLGAGGTFSNEVLERLAQKADGLRRLFG